MNLKISAPQIFKKLYKPLNLLTDSKLLLISGVEGAARRKVRRSAVLRPTARPDACPASPSSAVRLLDGSGHNLLMKRVNLTRFCYMKRKKRKKQKRAEKEEKKSLTSLEPGHNTGEGRTQSLSLDAAFDVADPISL